MLKLAYNLQVRRKAVKTFSRRLPYQAILDFIAKKGKSTAREIATHFGISMRSVYRYVEDINERIKTLFYKKGKGGGIYFAEEAL